MNALERQSAILGVLCRERHVTLKCLAERFLVCRNTIQGDIEALSCTYPIKTVRGRYGGGVFLAGDYRPDRKQLSAAQLDLLQRLLSDLSGRDHDLMKAIIAQFGPNGTLL